MPDQAVHDTLTTNQRGIHGEVIPEGFGNPKRVGRIVFSVGRGRIFLGYHPKGTFDTSTGRWKEVKSGFSGLVAVWEKQ